MATCLPEAAVSAAAMGRFGEALRLLRAAGIAALSPSLQVLHAELLERTGELGRASAQVARLARRREVAPVDKSRCALVEGLLAQHRGHLASAAQAFRNACAIAEGSNSLETLGWAQLRLLTLMEESPGSDSATHLRLTLRGNVDRAASPTLTAAFHLFSAESAAKSGFLDLSSRHAGTAETLLVSRPNVWLKGLLALHRACVGFLDGAYDSSLNAGREALVLATESSHRHTRVSALANLGAAYLALGQNRRAHACLSVALAETERSEQHHGLILESMAEVQLAEGDYEACAASLEQARQLALALGQTRSAWHRTWNSRTCARLLQRQGRWLDSARVLTPVTDTGGNDSAAAMDALTRALYTVGVVNSASFSAASASLAGLLLCSRTASTGYHGLVQTAIADYLAGHSSRQLGVSAFDPALRLLARTAGASYLTDLVRRLHCDRGEPTVDRRLEAAAGWHPTQIRCHTERTTVIGEAPAPSVTDLLGLIGMVPGIREDPVAVGEEVLRLLTGFGWLAAGAVVDVGSGRHLSLVTCAASPIAAHTFFESKDKLLPIDVRIGTKRGSELRLVLRPSHEAESVLACSVVARMLSSAADDRTPVESKSEHRPYRDTPDGGPDGFGVFASSVMLNIVDMAKRVAPYSVPVLLTGESGTGKEVIARLIHAHSAASAGPFLAVNCAAVPCELLESQLFGYRRGAFTGATEPFDGVIKAADGGTLLLDEVGELPLGVQPKLLRFLDAMEVHPLGQSTPGKVRVRVIAATNSDLEHMVHERRFREDLYYRLVVVHFRLPPLRERREEIRVMADRFLKSACREFCKDTLTISEDAMEHLLLRDWPGNVRQLSHEIRRAVALSGQTTELRLSDFQQPAPTGEGDATSEGSTRSNTMLVGLEQPLRRMIAGVERGAIQRALQTEGGLVDKAAARLGISRKGLYLKRRRLGL
jgi:DNA-binding NtrC family response regulator/tetratricopeptide (TPR) repeat protein